MHVSYDEAVKYAKGDASDARKLGGTAHIGQIIVVDGPNEKGKNGVWTYQLVPSTREGYYAELQPIGGGNGSLAVETLNLAEHATEIGQIIYVTTGDDNYPAGPYIVTSVGNVSRIGTTTADGDLAGAISTLESYVGKPAGENIEASGLFASIAALEAKDTETSNSITGLDTKYSGEVQRIDGDITSIKNNWKVKDVISGETSLVGENGIVDLTAYVTKSYVDTAVSGIEVPEYEIKKLDDNDAFASQYALYKDGTQVGPTIDILKDMVVSGAQMVTDPEGQEPGRYIELTIANNDGTKVYINVTELINNYNGSTYITVNGDGTISLNYDTVKSQLTTDFANVFDAYGSASAVNTALDNYKTEVSGKFADYFTKEEVNTKFADYLIKEEINTKLADYFTKEEIEATVATLATKEEVTEVSDALSTYKNEITEAFKAYSTTTEVEGKISTALESYYTKTEVDDAITTASNEINANFANYFTKEEVGTQITNALGSYYTKEEAEGKFLDKTSVIDNSTIDAIVNGTYQEA
jgi:hypothetical protein